MITIAILGVLSLSPVTPYPLPAVSSTAPQFILQDEEEVEIQDKREDIKELIDKLKDHVKKRGKEDDQAIAAIDKLNQEFPGLGPKDRAAVVKAIEANFKAKRTELQPGVPDDRLYYASAVVLRKMAPESVKPLVSLVDGKKVKDNMRVRRELILSLGKTEDPAGVKPLLGLIKDKDAEMQAASAEALGYHSAAPLKVRKQIFQELLKIMMGQKAQVDSDTTNIEARDRWDTIAGPIISSLQLLSGHDERDPVEWQRWWNKNKKADWDEDDG